MFCRYCGKQLPEEAEFCPYCGKQLKQSPVQKQNVSPPKKVSFIEKHKNLFCLAVVAVFFTVAISLAMNKTPASPVDSFDDRLRELKREAQIDLDEQLKQNSEAAQPAKTSQPKVDSKSEPEGVPEPEPQTGGTPDLSTPPSSSSTLLPDIGLYIDCARHEDQPNDDGDDGWLLSYSYQDNGGTAEDEVLALLQQGRYQLRLDDYMENDYDNLVPRVRRRYCFFYTGTGTVERFTDDLFEDTTADYQVALYIHRSTDTGRILMAIRYGNSFTLEDPEVRGTRVSGLDGSSGGGSSGGGDSVAAPWDNAGSSSTKIRRPCTECHGYKTVDCSRCGGKGTIPGVVTGPNHDGKGTGTQRADKPCPVSDCYHGKVPCRHCNGTGDEP